MNFIKLNKAVTVILCVLAVICLSSCRTASPADAAQEFSSHSRYISSDKDTVLELDDDFLKVKCRSQDLTISGEYFADEKTVTLTTDDCGDLVFDYYFRDGNLHIGYAGMEMTFSAA